jgi:hypothetical protein
VTIALNLATLLRSHVRGGPCRVCVSDMKARVEAESGRKDKPDGVLLTGVA